MAARPARKSATAQALLALTLAAPALVLVSAFAVRFGLLPVGTGYSLLTLQVAWWLSFAGVAAAIACVALAVRDVRRLGLYAVAAVLIAGAVLGVFVWQKGRIANGPVENVSTDPDEVPGFSDALAAQRGEGGPGPAVGPEACPRAQPVMRQLAPESAMWALQQAGFSIRGAGVGRADGTREGYWFGFTHDAVIRIRPGRTDIRVAARDGLPHGGEACRLAAEMSEALRIGVN